MHSMKAQEKKMGTKEVRRGAKRDVELHSCAGSLADAK